MDPKVQIYVMSHNRPEYISQTINSILKQTHDNYEMIVSENSSDDSVESLLKAQFPQVKYVRRNPMLNMSQHWNQIISEATAPYFMMFHDDDILLPHALERLCATLEQHPKAAAAAGNAHIIRNSNPTAEIFNKGLKQKKIISSAAELGQQYFNPKNGVQPFPGYLYRTSLCQQIKVNNREAGKHSDVTFLMKCLRVGPLIWIPDLTLNYRYHQSNDSVGFDIIALSNLVKFYQRESHLGKGEISSQEFRVKNYILWLREYGASKLKQDNPLRHKIILRFVYGFFAKHPLSLAKILLRRMIKT